MSTEKIKFIQIFSILISVALLINIASSINTQAKLSNLSTIIDVAVNERGDYVDVILKVYNNNNMDMTYDWKIILFDGDEEVATHYFSKNIKSGESFSHSSSFPGQGGKDNIRATIKVYGENKLLEEREYYLGER